MLADGVTVLEADSFEPEMEIVIVTEDDQKIPVPVGEYEMEDGSILVVENEGIISEMKEMETEEEAPEVEEEVEVETEKKEEMETAKAAPKKTIESVVKETFFAEIEALKTENEMLKAELAKINEVTETELSELKPISFNPENDNPIEITRLASKKPRTIMDSVLDKLSK
jgi:hypothetical protein